MIVDRMLYFHFYHVKYLFKNTDFCPGKVESFGTAIRKKFISLHISSQLGAVQKVGMKEQSDAAGAYIAIGDFHCNCLSGLKRGHGLLIKIIWGTTIGEVTPFGFFQPNGVYPIM